MTAHRNEHVQHKTHARVTGILQSGGTVYDVMRLLYLDKDNAIAAIGRAKAWHKEHPGNYEHAATQRGVRDLILGGGHACATVDPELFFIGDTRGAHNTYDQARRVCAACEVRVPCAEYAIADPSLAGLWGGLDPQERVEIRRRKRGAQ